MSELLMSVTSRRALARRIREATGCDGASASEEARALLDGDGAPIGSTREVDAYGYVQCVYGTEGDEPGDCRALILQDAAGIYWVEDGDDALTVETSGPYWTEEAAREKAADRSAGGTS